jgi:hypothetical protein
MCGYVGKESRVSVEEEVWEAVRMRDVTNELLRHNGLMGRYVRL